MGLEAMYQEIILDHYRNPVGRGLRDPFDVEVSHVNPSCGDELQLRLRLSEDRATVLDISYEGQGCAISQASISVLAELAADRPVAEVAVVREAFLALMSSRGAGEPDEDILGDAVAFAGVAKFPARVKCALLGWMAYQDALVQTGAGSQEVRKGVR
jgi:nitrogen fixation protein NifU and related proteins